MACIHRNMRNLYRVIYVNNTTGITLITDCIDSLASVLYEEEDEHALTLLKNCYSDDGEPDFEENMLGLMKSFRKCNNQLMKVQNKMIICYVDQINEIYNDSTDQLKKYNKRWLSMLSEETFLVTSGSARNEYPSEQSLAIGPKKNRQYN